MTNIVSLLLVLTLPLVSFSHQKIKKTRSPNSNIAPFQLGTNENDYYTFEAILARKLLREGFARLGLPLKFVPYPLARLNIENVSGRIDGELARIEDYGRRNPNLVRVEESTMVFDVSLFTANPNIDLKKIDPEISKKYTFAYRRGSHVCGLLMKEYNATQVNHSEMGVKLLLSGRVDLYCELEFKVRSILKSSSYQHEKRVRRLFDLKKAVFTYPYFNSKHKDLALKLAIVLKGIKKEKLYKKFQEDARKEAALPHPLDPAFYIE